MRDFASLQADFVRGFGMRITVSLLFAVALTWLGALHSGSYDVFSRIGYWTINLVAWAFLSTICVRLFRYASSSSRWQIVLGATAAASVPMLAISSTVTSAISDWGASPGQLLELLPSIWLIGGAHLALCETLEAPIPETVVRTEPPSPVADTASNGLIDRLPLHLGTDIVCLRVEDHYVRVYTARGSALILTRFADALRDVADIPGMRVHRSWWVASGVVEAFARTGRTGELHLSNGIVVPISQPYLADAVARWGKCLAAAA